MGLFVMLTKIAKYVLPYFITKLSNKILKKFYAGMQKNFSVVKIIFECLPIISTIRYFVVRSPSSS